MLIGFVLSVAAVFPISTFARRIGWMDRPGGIKAHNAPTPYGGGVAIAFGALIGALVAGSARDEAAFIILTTSLIIFAGGVYDDFHPLGAAAKLSIQIAAAVVLILYDVRLHIRVLPDAVNIALTVFWLVGVSNAVNMIDIMDGLAGGVTGMAAFAFGLIGLLFGESGLAAPALALCGAISGFLVFNFRPARIFMGDAGAQFIGFLLAALAVKGSYTTFNSMALLAPVLILGVPIFDTTLITVLRLRKGHSPFQASNDHLALRLRRMGLSVDATVRACILTTAILAAAATVATMVSLPIAVAIYAVTGSVAVGLAWRVGRVEVD